MKYIFLMVLLQFTIEVYSQEFKIVDAQTNEPVPFATVILKKENQNIHADYADDKGVVNLSGVPAFDTAEISCVGFKSLSVLKNNITGTLYLENETVVLDEVVISKRDPVLLGEFNAKQKKYKTLNKMYINSYYFENTSGKRPIIESLLFKVDKVHQKTAVRVHLYARRNYTQLTYHPQTKEKSSYESFIPGEELLLDNIIYYIEPRDEGIVEIDLLKYGVEMPDSGVFAAVECLGYYNGSGILIDMPKKPTKIEMHYTTTDNYAGKLVQHRSWMNINRWIKHDFETVIKATPSKKSLLAPTFGLKVSGL
jgi:hypothetical protein